MCYNLTLRGWWTSGVDSSMRRKATLTLTMTVALMVCASGEASPADNAAIRITETAQAYELTVPVSRLVMTIPKGEFTHRDQDRAGAAGNPRYFIFRHKSLNLTVSGWFEPEQNFPGLKRLWAEKSIVLGRSGPAPEEVSFGKIGGWQTISYIIPDPAIPLINSSISAHWVQAGTWIELSLSIIAAQADKQSSARLVELLKSIQVNEKE
jgi:hypothetical protein